MAERKQRLISLITSLVLVGLNLAALNVLLAGWSTARLDLTEEGIFSISPATKRLLTSLDEDLTIYGYFSKRTHPKLAPLIPEVVDLLDEYRAVSRGKLQVEIIDPGEDEAAEQEAADRFGVRSTPFRLATKYESAIVNAYFALVVQYGDEYVRYGFEDLIQIEPMPDGDVEVKLRNLEYDLTRAIKKSVYGFRSMHELFERSEGPVKLVAIWTPATLPELFAGVPEAVRKAAEELREAAGDRFVFEEIDPSREEQLAQEVHQRFGAQPMSASLFGEGSFYLYAVLQSGDRMEQVPLVDEAITAASVRESIEDALRRQTPGFLKTVGIVAPGAEELPPELRFQLQMPPTPPPEYEEVKEFLAQDYQTRQVDLAAENGVPSEVDVLLVLEPKGLTEQQVYNLDQYLMRGGRVVICSGRYDVNFSADGLSLTPLETGLEDWLDHFGVSITPTLVLDDRNQPLPMPRVRQTPFGALRTWELEPYPYLVQVREDGLLNRDVTARLDSVGIYWGSPLVVEQEKAKGLEVLPLLQSSTRSWTNDDLNRVGFIEYEVPQEGTEPHLLAAAFGGRFKSYFAERGAPAAEGGASGRPGIVSLEESPETRLVVVGNSEFLSDFVARALARVDGGFFVENLRFVQNLIDWVSLDNDMLDIRSRGLVSRRLRRLGSGQETLIENMSYAVPLIVLIGLGAYLRFRRRQTAPLAGA